MHSIKDALVSLVKTSPRPTAEAVAAAVRKAVNLAGGLPEAISSGKMVLLKPNLVEVPHARESGAVTHPYLCRAVAEMVLERGARPIIGDSAGVGSDTEAVIDFMGYGDLRKEGFTILDLKNDKIIKVRNPFATILPEMYVYETALQADAIINLPVLKTHDQAEVTLSIKNLKGLLADSSKKAMHRRGLFRGVPEMARFFMPCFTVLDGIYAQEGVGPVFGDPVEMDLVMASRDMVALDTIAGLIMGYNPGESPVTALAAEMKLGCGDPAKINIAGLPYESVKRRFKRSSEAEILHKDLACSLEIGADACTGCRNTVIAVLVELRDRGLLKLLQGKALIAGTPPAKLPAGELILIGTCTRALRDKGTFIKGCPPENSWIIKALEK